MGVGEQRLVAVQERRDGDGLVGNLEGGAVQQKEKGTEFTKRGGARGMSDR